MPSPLPRASSRAASRAGSAGRASGPRRRALDPAGRRRGDVHDEPRAGGARPRLEARTSRSPQPQAVVINSGVANAATGERGELDALATARRGRRGCSTSTREEVLVLSTGVIGVRLPLDKVLAGLRGRGRGALARGRRDAAEAILTTDTGPKEAVVRARRLHGRRDGEGRRDDPSRASRRCSPSSRPTTRSSRARRSTFLRPAVERELQPRSRSTASARRTTRSCSCSRTARAACRRATTRRFAAALARGLRRARARRSSPTARARPCCSRSTSPARRRTREARRSPGGSRPRRSSRRRRSATTRTGAACSRRPGSAPCNGGFAQLDADRVTLSFNGDGGVRRAARRPAREPDARGPGCRIELDLGLGDGRGRVPRLRPHLRLRPHQRGVHDVSRVVLKCGGASRRTGRGTARARLARRATTSASSTAPGRRSSAEMERARDSSRPLRRRPARDRRRGARRRARVAGRGQRRAVRRDRPARPLGLVGDEIGLRATQLPSSASSASRSPGGPRRRGALAARSDPRGRAARRRAAERERRRGGRRARRRARRRRGSSSSQTSPACSSTARCSRSIDADDADGAARATARSRAGSSRSCRRPSGRPAAA